MNEARIEGTGVTIALRAVVAAALLYAPLPSDRLGGLWVTCASLALAALWDCRRRPLTFWYVLAIMPYSAVYLPHAGALIHALRALALALSIIGPGVGEAWETHRWPRTAWLGGILTLCAGIAVIWLPAALRLWRG